MSVNKTVSENPSALIFLPTEVDDLGNAFLHGQIEISDKIVNIYVTATCRRFCEHCLGSYSTRDCKISAPWRMSNNWFHLRRTDHDFTLDELKINGVNNNCKGIGIVVIYYRQETFLEMDSSLFIQETSESHISTRNHFRILKLKLEQSETKAEKAFMTWDSGILSVFRCVLLFLSMLSTKTLIITKYSSLARHLNKYLMGLVWITEPGQLNKRIVIQKINISFAIMLDVLIGAISLIELTKYFPLDSLPNFLSGEIVVQLLKGLINWLTGNPAGFKLNYLFSKLLATFFLFYIDMWCAFLAILIPAYRTIMTIFFFIGKAGITFQMSITEDILTVLTFHIYCICLFAARLYNVQIKAVWSLWRLFLGRKKNPLRDRVDSCRYTSEQLFMGTLGFTILFFLLPTTLIYYVVFTVFRIILTSCKRALGNIRYLVQTLQPYSITLWLTASPKVSSGIKLIQYKPLTSRNCLVFYAQPVCPSLVDTLAKDKPDFFRKTEDFNFVQFIYSLMTGRVQH